ncbi:MAG: carboxypeptidase-like regulatory domain-containing protein [Bacteroidales bacterium]|jgi:hypothetical protein|nr:carboxypeptidase-like regulatory domain-containing protein [Bacteroidales bacterium]
MEKIKILLVIKLTLFICVLGVSQNSAVKGIIYDSESKPAQLVNINVAGMSLGTSTDMDGNFELKVPSNVDLVLEISYLGHEMYVLKLKLKPGEVAQHKIYLEQKYTMLPGAEIRGDIHSAYTRIDNSVTKKIPTHDGVAGILKTLPSVSSNNELSSQYNVRGGNFDENMVFVNDVEIYRPILIRSGNQEGLSFLNSDMISSILFSAGGFDAKYGDKMSSVLDIKYRQPREFGGSVSASLLGADVHLEGTSKNHLFRYNTGLRYKTTKYILSSMDMSGQYDPNYLDFQTYMTYDLNDKVELSFLGNINSNKYKFVPEDRKTSFGARDNAMNVTMYFEGQEIDQFTNATGALTALYRMNLNTNLKFIFSTYYTNEEETFDILGEYYLNELDASQGSNHLGDSVVNIGIGKYLDHARNYLTGNVFSFKHMGDINKKNHNILWGIQYNYEDYDYHINEWTMIDSAGYSIWSPGYRDDSIKLYFVDIGEVGIRSSRISAYIQDSYEFNFDKFNLSLGGGVRFNYWSYNNEFLASPRISLGIHPYWNKNFIFRFATGLYHQPPTIKEIRRMDGTINKDIKAQSSYHVVLGADYEFKMWNRPFKLSTEIFYKYLYNLNPYSVDNVKITYFGENIAEGYAAGIEAKINGEFVKGTESWFSISFMKTEEKIDGAYYTTKNDEGKLDTVMYGFIPRPTDQRLNIGIFFQDYIPGNQSWQVHLSLLFGTSLPYNILNKDKYLSIGKFRPYRRVDLGVSKRLISSEKKLPKGNIFRYFKEMWISLEVFNLLDIDNTISYTWVTSIQGEQYGVPNYLTGRRLNLKLVAKF